MMPSVHVALHRFRPCAPDREHFEIRSNGSERSQQVLFIRKLWTCRVRADRHWSVLTKSNMSAVPSYKNVHYSARHLSRSHGLWPSNFSVKTLINLLLKYFKLLLCYHLQSPKEEQKRLIQVNRWKNERKWRLRIVVLAQRVFDYTQMVKLLSLCLMGTDNRCGKNKE